jgi:hypothetical protein
MGVDLIIEQVSMKQRTIFPMDIVFTAIALENESTITSSLS